MPQKYFDYNMKQKKVSDRTIRRGSLTIKRIDDSLLTEDSNHFPYYEKQIKTLRVTFKKKENKFIVYEHERKKGYKQIKTYKKTKNLKTKEDVINKIHKTNFRIQDKSLVLGSNKTFRVQTNYLPNVKKFIQVIGVCHILHTKSGREDIVLGFSGAHTRSSIKNETEDIDHEIEFSAVKKFVAKNPRLNLKSDDDNFIINILDRRYIYFTRRK